MHGPRSLPWSSLCRVASIIVGGAVIAISTPGLHARARLQATTAPAQSAAAPNSNPISLGELNRLFEAYAVVQAQDFLKLTDEQYPDFVARLKALQDARRRHFQNHQRIVNDLRRMLHLPEEQLDEKSLRATYESLDREDESAETEIKKAFQNVISILDVRQRARFRVFEENLERRKLDLLSRVQQRKPSAPPAATK